MPILWPCKQAIYRCQCLVITWNQYQYLVITSSTVVLLTIKHCNLLWMSLLNKTDLSRTLECWHLRPNYLPGRVPNNCTHITHINFNISLTKNYWYENHVYVTINVDNWSFYRITGHSIEWLNILVFLHNNRLFYRIAALFGECGKCWMLNTLTGQCDNISYDFLHCPRKFG